jgi:hypothetical protein
MSFFVNSDGTNWNTFHLTAAFVATTCYNSSGQLETTTPGPGNIINNQFSISSSIFSATGQFTSPTTATGTYSFSQNIIVPLPFPPYTCSYYFNESGTWTASIPIPSIIISGNTGVGGVTLSYTDGAPKTATSDGSGNYSISVPAGWSGTVTPYKTGYHFTPFSRTYSNLQSSQTAQNYTAQACAGCADVNVLIGGAPSGAYTLDAGESTRQSYPGVNNGPVKVDSTNAVPIIAAERLIYKINGVDASFTEMMALPNSQLDTTYWLPWYNNTGLDTQLRFGAP